MGMTMCVAAGGTGGHIFPALAVVRALRAQSSDIRVIWVGTVRSREKELCTRENIPCLLLSVSGLQGNGLSRLSAGLKFIRSLFSVFMFYRKEKPVGIIAFGGYVSASAIVGAILMRKPFFLHEQNAVPGKVNRFFSVLARINFLSFPLQAPWRIVGEKEISGLPVRAVAQSYSSFAYPANLDQRKPIILICGGSQGAQSMNRCLVTSVRRWASNGVQIVWQTGDAGYKEVVLEMADYPNVFVFESVDDLYPYYAIARFVIGRAGASTLGEAAAFGKPLVAIPLPWAADNHQWMNAGIPRTQGWGFRIKQDDGTGGNVERAVDKLLNNKEQYEKMCTAARTHSPAPAAGIIAQRTIKELTR